MYGYLYRFKNENDEVIGVVKTSRFVTRNTQSFLFGNLAEGCFAETVKIEYLRLPSEADASILERYLTGKLMPKYNILYKEEGVPSVSVDYSEFPWIVYFSNGKIQEDNITFDAFLNSKSDLFPKKEIVKHDDASVYVSDNKCPVDVSSVSVQDVIADSVPYISGDTDEKSFGSVTDDGIGSKEDVFVRFLDEMLPLFKWDLLPFPFLKELYSSWGSVHYGKKDEYHIKRNDFVDVLMKYIGRYPDWECLGRDRTVRVWNRMSANEPLLDVYGLSHWRDAVSRSDSYRGLVRVKHEE